jgi:hypothetical protein
MNRKLTEVTRPSRRRALPFPSRNVPTPRPYIRPPGPVRRDPAIMAGIIVVGSIVAGAVTVLWRHVSPPPPRNIPEWTQPSGRLALPSPSRNVPAPRPYIPPPRPVPRDPAITAGIIGAVGSIVAGAVTAIVTLVTVYHPPATSTDINNSQSQPSCPVVAEDYYIELHRNPGIVKALIGVATADTDARRCGIDATTIELMKNGTSS